MDDAAEEERFTLRPYQDEMLRESLKRNVIVAMDTGSGKTAIAIERARAALEVCPSSQIVWFLAPTVNLCMQQFSVFEKHLPAYKSRVLTGHDNIDRWTDQIQWDAVLQDIRVVVSTYGLLHEALGHGFVQMSSLELIIYDEAHNCIKDNPGNKIMQDFYFRNVSQGKPVPHVLGLTASPVISGGVQGISDLEMNMHSRVITPQKARSELLKHVHQPHLCKITYPSSESSPATAIPPLLQALSHEERHYDIFTDPYVLELRSSDPAKLMTAVMGRQTYCFQHLGKVHRQTLSVLEQLGPTAATRYLSDTIERFNGLYNRNGQLAAWDNEEKEHLRRIFLRISQTAQTATEGQSGSDEPDVLSPKVESLIKLLESESENMTGLIFVKERANVRALANLLSRHPVVGSKFVIRDFVGLASSDKKAKHVVEPVDIKKQLKTLEDFRTGVVNFIVATSVLEEGIDVPSCNIVICFDPPGNLKSYVQGRGRARHERSKYVIILPEGDPVAGPHEWAELEEEMKQEYLRNMTIDSTPMEGSEKVGRRQYRVESTGALLTTDNAMGHLYHFCTTLYSVSYVDMRPQFAYHSDKSGMVSAEVTLPACVDPSLRQFRSSRSFIAEKNARADAAYEAYLGLYQAGLINDNLLPLTKEPETVEMATNPNAQLIEVATRLNPWAAVARQWSDEGELVEYCISWTKDRKEFPDFSLRVPCELVIPPQFTVHLNPSTTYEISIRKVGRLPYTKANFDGFQGFSKALLWPVHSSRMVAGTEPFVTPFGPREYANLDACTFQWMSNPDLGKQPVLDVLGVLDQDLKGRIVHHKYQMWHRFVFQRVAEPSGGDEGVNIVVTQFLKRRDFLHRVATGLLSHKYTTELILPASECFFESLPVDFVTFSLFIPSILRRFEMRMIAEELRTTLLGPVGIQNLEYVQTAIMHDAAQEDSNYQRQEFLGDCVLKYIMSVDVISKNPKWPEGYLSQEKDRRVSNRRLCRAALDKGLDRFIVNDSFTGLKWRPYYIHEVLAAEPEKRELSPKVIADVVEALIGAAMLDGGVPAAQSCITLFLSDFQLAPIKESVAELFSHASDAALNLASLETLVGYIFRKKSLLLEAITHPSFQQYGPMVTNSYQRLEFLGDAVLDLVVVKRIWETHSHLEHHEMHDARAAVVNSLILGFLCMEFEAQPSPSTSDLAAPGSASRLCDFLRYSSAGVFAVREKAFERYGQFKMEVREGLTHGTVYPWAALCRVQPDKLFSDMIEALVGAIFVDSGGNEDAVVQFLERAGVWRVLERLLSGGMLARHPKVELGRLARGQKVDYESEVRSGMWWCRVIVGGKPGVWCTGTTRVDVETEAAMRGVQRFGKVDLEADVGTDLDTGLGTGSDTNLEIVSETEMDLSP
ncbi:P-loop containing nucleoside triphosphate hydrolase protein [Trichodelitschia bisporula]|uniref:P-loop containing nucleoside triphosphate hydrolase protein n=1 Tax=Trichodelitschia bisporula TaxID=703511 RepID=A0A6G1I6A1_9PEZI|nr:P-loop containing nucleoside triphosphate hydrolase protein [Trichodelitschia bisporula]